MKRRRPSWLAYEPPIWPDMWVDRYFSEVECTFAEFDTKAARDAWVSQSPDERCAIDSEGLRFLGRRNPDANYIDFRHAA